MRNEVLKGLVSGNYFLSSSSGMMELVNDIFWRYHVEYEAFFAIVAAHAFANHRGHFAESLVPLGKQRL